MITRTLEHWRALPDLSMREAGEVLGVGRGSVEALVQDGKLERRKRCGKWFVTVESVRRMVGECAESKGNPALERPRYSAHDRKALKALKGGR